jgi:excisionase family DNA binding protein
MTRLALKVAYSVPEAAELCGVDRRTMLRWVQNGVLRATRVGHFWRITNASLREHPDLWDSILFRKGVSDDE